MDKVVISKCHCGSVELELTLPNGFDMEATAAQIID